MTATRTTATKAVPDMFVIRRAEVQDENFLVSSLLKQMRTSGFYASFSESEFREHAAPKLISHAIENAEVWVACPVAVKESIAGWLSVGTDKSLRFAYTKSPYRGFGCATKLLEAAGLSLSAPITYTLRSYLAERYERSMQEKGRTIKHVPAFSLRITENTGKEQEQ